MEVCDAERPFRPGVETRRPKMAPAEAAFAGLFYAALLAQIVAALVVIGSKNSEMGARVETGQKTVSLYEYLFLGRRHRGTFACSRGMVLMSECDPRHAGHECVSRSLCEKARTCAANFKISGRQLASKKRKIAPNVWALLAEHVHKPAKLFATVFALAVVWLFLLYKAAKPVIWCTVAADILALVALFVFIRTEFHEANWMCIVVAVAGLAMAVWFRDQINEAAVVMTWAMAALGHNRRALLVCGGVVLLWGCYFTLWVRSLICMFFVQTVVEVGPACTLQPTAWAMAMRWGWIWSYYWTTSFFLNAKLLVLTPQIAAWYFHQPRSDFLWGDSARWAFGSLAGGNALCSTFMGVTERLLVYHDSRCRLIAGLCNPMEWPAIFVAFALKQCLFAYTKFGLIAQAYTGEPFCSTAGKALELLRHKLGDAFICDYLGARVMSWCTWVLSLGIAFATWAWAERLQMEGPSAFSDPGSIFAVGVGLAYFISFPSATVALIVVVEGFISDWDGWFHDWFRDIFNVLFASLFCGSVCHIILENVSHVIVNTMDIIFFCYAVEVDNLQTQDRFEELYASIAKSTAPGGAQSSRRLPITRPAMVQLTPAA